ncbi:hypothetical protein [Nocardia noduli]|uniref:hypothetical protein n=1 Tax=Nocardia noduli TaxID=2815722 RepID=UPI001C224117|nr:hypothetical protein [Nocardia noduli]
MVWWLSWLIIGGAGAVAVVVLVGVMYLAVGNPDNPDRHRVADPDEENDSVSTSFLPIEISQANVGHEAPESAFTVAEAHHEMEIHQFCRLEHCPRKSSALRTLVHTGRAPDSRK